MPSPTSRIRLLKQAPGSNFDSWGTQLNVGAIDMVDEAFGVTEIAVGANLTLTVQDYIIDQARRLVLVCTGAGGFTVTVPEVEKPYLVVNNCAANVTVTPQGGTGAVIRAGTAAWWYCDGTNGIVIDAPLDKIKTAESDVAFGGNKLTGVAAGTASTDAATLSNRPEQFAAPTAALSMNSQRITNLAAPSASTDAASRQWVADEIAAAATLSLPSVTGESGKFLSNNGTSAGWAAILAGTGITKTGTAGADQTLAVNVGTDADQIPQNSDLGAAAYLDVGTLAAQIPRNSDLGTAATKNTGTAAGEVPTNADLPDFFPSGGIIMWSGSIASIPSGWALCDGTEGTPDLRNRFIVGAGSTYAVNDTGGADSVTLTTAQLPSHTHGAGTLATGSAGAHTHTGSTNTTGSHSHNIKTNASPSGVGPTAIIAGTATPSTFTNFAADAAGDHAHSLSINSGGAHTHSISGSAAAAGSGNGHENRPPYFALAFIMKL